MHWLRKGHNQLRRRGREAHDAVRVRWADIDPGELQPREHCCTSEWLKRHDKLPAAPEKPCLVQDGDCWWPGMPTWERTPRSDGLWWANVRYRRDGREVTEVRSQHDLRRRPARHTGSHTA